MEKVLSIAQQRYLGYIPAQVIKNIIDDKINSKKNLPQYDLITTVSLFADISGFTKLSEAYSKKGRIGPEFLAFSLNRYMELLINIIGKNGGDIFKFAGDALLVIWPENKDLSLSCRRAIQCALDIQGTLNEKEIGPNKKLSVKIGIGVGECRILIVGGLFKRCEYLCIGEALRQACESETKAKSGGQTICSEYVKKYVESNFKFKEINDNHHEKYFLVDSFIGERLQIVSESYIIRSKFDNDIRLKENMNFIKTFVPAAVRIYLDIEMEIWSKEIRMLTIMFLNLKVDLSQSSNKEGIDRIQEIVRTVQRCVYLTRGSLNKFLMDDKGSVMIITWGLPPLSSKDDPINSVLSAHTLVNELKKYNCGAYIGITTGTCFTGVCGTIGNRREYSLLGEIVNLSARFMQKAIEWAKAKNLEYCILIDEKTKNLIQNNILSEYVFEGEVKGFTINFKFYSPVFDKIDITIYNYFPNILTHRDNANEKKIEEKINKSPYDFFKLSLFIVGMKNELNDLVDFLYESTRLSNTEILIISGMIGIGKSLLLRKGLYNFLESNAGLKNIHLKNEYPFILITYQTPLTYNNPLNAFDLNLRIIYNKICNIKTILINDDNYIANDIIGNFLIESQSIQYISYIEEILKLDLSSHYKVNDTNIEIYKLPSRDKFFTKMKFNFYTEQEKVLNFFLLMVKYYKHICDENKIPLIFIIEDSQYIDELSINFIRILEQSNIAISIILTYQTKIAEYIKNPFDKMPSSNLLDNKTIYIDYMDDYKEVKELIIAYMANNKLIIKSVDNALIEILIMKSFNGIPLFIIDILENLLHSKKFIQHLSTELIITSELIDMIETRNWADFTIPMRIEKLVGSIIDSLSTYEIIILKYASVIGNIFDINSLIQFNLFNLDIDQLYKILQNLEKNRILEFLYDLKPKHLICKFNISFMREILYQQLLIEQKTDIHNNFARSLQSSKFKFMSYDEELKYLIYHLKIAGKNLINYIEEEDDDIYKLNNLTESLNINNLKIFIIKEIINRLKVRGDNNNSIVSINSGVVEKKSDKGLSWEDRYLVINNRKLFYWYYESDYKQKKVPLGSFHMNHVDEIKILPDGEIGGRKNIIMIIVNTWFKKGIQMGERNYYFSVKSREELLSWIISLNIIRINVIYNEFVKCYGEISLPLNHELKKISKTVKYNFNKINRSYNETAYINQRNIKRSSLSLKRLSVTGSTNSINNLIRSINQEDNTVKVKNYIKDIINCAYSILIINISQNSFSDSKQNANDFFIPTPDVLREMNDSISSISSSNKKNSCNITIDEAYINPVKETNNFFHDKLIEEEDNIVSIKSQKEDINIDFKPNQISFNDEIISIPKNDQIQRNTPAIFTFDTQSDNKSIREEEKKEVTEKTNNDIIDKEDKNFFSISNRPSIIPKYSEPKFDYLKNSKKNYGFYQSNLFKNIK